MDYKDTYLGLLDDFLLDEIFTLVYRDLFDVVVKQIERQLLEFKNELDRHFGSKIRPHLSDIVSHAWLVRNEDMLLRTKTDIVIYQLHLLAISMGWIDEDSYFRKMTLVSTYRFWGGGQSPP
jgi:hypothetical protein